MIQIYVTQSVQTVSFYAVKPHHSDCSTSGEEPNQRTMATIYNLQILITYKSLDWYFWAVLLYWCAKRLDWLPWDRSIMWRKKFSSRLHSKRQCASNLCTSSKSRAVGSTPRNELAFLSRCIPVCVGNNFVRD